MNISLLYFSATGVTNTYAQVIHNELVKLGSSVDMQNITPYSARQRPLLISKYDAFIFGFPVYADFAPSVINEWIPSLDGQGKRCGMFFTYGARTTGYAHFHTKLLLEGANFRVYFSAEFLGRHSFNLGGWDILPERPDEKDFVVARDLAKVAVERFSKGGQSLLELQKPFGYYYAIKALKEKKTSKKRGWTNPFRAESNCSMCLACETECPTRSFDAAAGTSDPKTCIECLHCVYVCPDEVIQLDEEMKIPYGAFKTYCHLTDEMMNAKRSKIITEFWQAAT